MSFLTAILSPTFLVNNIQLIALVASAVVLVFFEDAVIKGVILPAADFVKFKVFEHVGAIYNKRGIKSGLANIIRKYIAEAVATFLVIFYCYSGSVLLGIYILEPIFQRLKFMISIIVLGLFFLINYVINNSRIRAILFRLHEGRSKKK